MPPFRHGSSLQFLWSWYFYPCNPNSRDIIGKLYVEDTSVAITIYQPWHLRMIPHLENGWCRIWRTDHRSIHLPFHIFAVSPPWSLSLYTYIYIYMCIYTYPIIHRYMRPPRWLSWFLSPMTMLHDLWL